jgi:hypothetical protein
MGATGGSVGAVAANSDAGGMGMGESISSTRRLRARFWGESAGTSG